MTRQVTRVNPPNPDAPKPGGNIVESDGRQLEANHEQIEQVIRTAEAQSGPEEKEEKSSAKKGD